MKISKSYLRKIIKEELSNILEESYSPRGTGLKHAYLGPDDEFEAWKDADAAKDKERERERAGEPDMMDDHTWFLKIGQHINIKDKDNRGLRSATRSQRQYWKDKKAKQHAQYLKSNPKWKEWFYGWFQE